MASNIIESDNTEDKLHNIKLFKSQALIVKAEISDTVKILHDKLTKKELELHSKIDTIVDNYEKNMIDNNVKLLELTKAQKDAQTIFQSNELTALLKETIDKIQLQIDSITLESREIPQITLLWGEQLFTRCLAKLCQISSIPHNYPYRYEPIVSVATKGNEIGQLNKPWGITIDDTSEKIYVADCNNNRIQVFDSSAKFLASYTHGDMKYPRALVVNHGNLYVSCHLKLLMLDTNGLLKNVLKIDFGIRGLDMYRYNNNNIYICCLEEHKLLVVDNSLEKMLPEIKLTSPHFIQDKFGLYHTYLSDIKIKYDIIYILCSNSTFAIQCFNFDGMFINCILNREDIGESFFFCLDSHRNIILGDCKAHHVQVYSEDGVLLANIGKKGENKGQLFTPMGIALNKDERIVVCDYKEDGLLQIF